MRTPWIWKDLLSLGNEKIKTTFWHLSFGGIYDLEFQEETEVLFEMVENGEIICVYSDLCEFELENAPGIVKEHFLSLDKDQTEFAEITEEINELIEEYVKDKVVGQTSVDECRHIVCATIN